MAGMLLLLGLVWALAVGSYRLAFRRWALRRETKPYYWLWQCGLAWLLFEGLQRRTEYALEFVDENILVTLVLLTVVVVYGYLADVGQSRQRQRELIQQHTQAELARLKAQINPHFLFNALNTIYNQAQLADNDRVAELISQLAGLMRFSLQEAQKPVTSIEQEIQFLEKYLALQQARLPPSDTLRIASRVDWDGEPTAIAPLLLIPFVENAFQYGISLVQPSYIELSLQIDNRQLRLYLANSLPPVPVPSGTGMGIANVRQRLALLYPDRFELRIQQTADSFVVHLNLSL
jgi:LytS/YehU family sensor histidine kinase